MGPGRVELLGVELAVWDVTLAAGVLVGYVVLRASFKLGGYERPPRMLPVRWVLTVYLSVLAAQLFAYLFDANTSVLPPVSVSWVRYYLDPLGGPKTLYGALVALPVVVYAVSVPSGDLKYTDALGHWTPASMTVLAVARLGCFLQGCCYGVRSDWLGVVFPIGSPPYYRHLEQGLISVGEAPLPVVPTQVFSALVLLGIAGWCLREIRDRRVFVFPDAIAMYSASRFAIEMVRDDPERNVYGLLSTSQWISVTLLGLYLAWRLACHAQRPVGIFASRQ